MSKPPRLYLMLRSNRPVRMPLISSRKSTLLQEPTKHLRRKRAGTKPTEIFGRTQARQLTLCTQTSCRNNSFSLSHFRTLAEMPMIIIQEPTLNPTRKNRVSFTTCAISRDHCCQQTLRRCSLRKLMWLIQTQRWTRASYLSSKTRSLSQHLPIRLTSRKVNRVRSNEVRHAWSVEGSPCWQWAVYQRLRTLMKTLWLLSRRRLGTTSFQD